MITLSTLWVFVQPEVKRAKYLAHSPVSRTSSTNVNYNNPVGWRIPQQKKGWKRTGPDIFKGLSRTKASQVVQWLRIYLPMQEMQWTRAWSLGQEDHLEEEMTAHCSILAWKIPWTEEQLGNSPRGHKQLDTTEWLSRVQGWISMVFLPFAPCCLYPFTPTLQKPWSWTKVKQESLLGYGWWWRQRENSGRVQ